MKSTVATEHAEQVALCNWWAMQCKSLGFSEHLLFAIPNGGNRSPITGRILKAEGVRPGVPDMMLAVPNDDFSGLFIELKRTHGGKTSDVQEQMLLDLQHQGYCAYVCHGWEEARMAILEYLTRPRMKTVREYSKISRSDGLNFG